MLTKKQTQFVAAIIEGAPAAQAYQTAFHPQTENPDSLRALASKERRKPAVSEAIEAGLRSITKEAIQGALWNLRASIVARVQDIAAIDAEIERRARGLALEIEAIETDETLSETERKQRIGRAMQRPIIGRDLIAAKQTIYAALDSVAIASQGPEQIPLWVKIIQLSQPFIDPDAFTAPAPI